MEGVEEGKLTLGVRPGEVEDRRNEGMKEEDKSTEGNRQMEAEV